jgi:anti-sigma regulatory factor (Ser/Thr protein kinase)
MNMHLRVDDSSQVAHVRREAVAFARGLAIDADATARLALAVTEAATNLVKHARDGMVLLSPLRADGSVGIEAIALDRGPGMANVATSMRDGHSTAGSPGYGLGSMSRIATNLDIYSRPGAGTVLRFEIWNRAPAPASAAVTIGGVCVPMPGETACGDAWSAHERKGRHRLLVVDGLGHGPDAALAAQAAVRAAGEHVDLEPAELMQHLHGALRNTRGAAGAAASSVPHTGRGAYAGVGNIRALTWGPAGVKHLVSHNGTLGHQARKIQSFEFDLAPRTMLVMHSDGIASHFDLHAYAGIERHHPSVIAATIFRDHWRGRDDATVVVMRNELRALQ